MHEKSGYDQGELLKILLFCSLQRTKKTATAVISHSSLILIGMDVDLHEVQKPTNR